MKAECEVIRDLLPLYVDDICSDTSRKLVEEHLEVCPECSEMREKLRSTEIESGLKIEKQDVISYGMRKFRQLSARRGTAVSGLLMIPIAALLVVNLMVGSSMGWFLIVLAALAVAASLIAVPILVPENKLFWTFCAFTGSLVVLLGVVCLVTRGNWFWVASSAALFGLSVCFLPFLIRARPLEKWVGGSNRVLIVLAVDAVLFINMMNMIRLYTSGGRHGLWLTVGAVAAIALAALYALKGRDGGR
ncbi:MAG: zf-HC2 domain-containing protein [Clostridia bacterium]|nr:zf-HC2 domain-containing protein [Clostridia bacterium]